MIEWSDSKTQRKKMKGQIFKFHELQSFSSKEPSIPNQEQLDPRKNKKENKKIKQEIIEISKSIIQQPTYQEYIQRGKLYAKSEKFYDALLDFEQANKLYKDKLEKELRKKNKGKNKNHNKTMNIKITNNKTQKQLIKPHTQQITRESEIFLQESPVIKKLPKLKKIARNFEKYQIYMSAQFNTQFAQIMERMIQQRVEKMIQQRMGKIQLKNAKQSNQNYEKLLSLVKKQEVKIKQLQNNLQTKVTDYSAIFYRQIQQNQLSELNKQKCIIYYRTLISQMERYYLAAKVLAQFEQPVSFEKYLQHQNQLSKGFINSIKSIIYKIFSMLKKNQSQIECIGQILKEVPYIGMIVGVIKGCCRVYDWFDSAKIESSCENILATRPNVTLFNRLSQKVAYQMYKKFKLFIITSYQSEKLKGNSWEKMREIYKNFKRNQIAARVYRQVKPSEKNYIKQIAQVHSSILMTGIAYGIFRMPDENELETKKWQDNIFRKISQIQTKLLTTQA